MNGTDQCVNSTNLFKFDGFSAPDLIKNLGKSEKEKDEEEEEKYGY